MFGEELPDYTQKALATLTVGFSDYLNSQKFYLAGGTALAIYIKHRVSYDLDWFTPESLDPQLFLRNIESTEISLSNVQTAPGTVYLNINDCKVAFFEYKYPLIGRTVEIPNSQAVMASELDIALMKITAIADRGTKKDFVDIFFLIELLGGLDVILNSFTQKFPNANLYHYLKSLTYFDDADKMPDLKMLQQVKWDDVKAKIKSEVKRLDLLV